MDKNDFKGFHNSFDAYCEWSEKQASLGLRSMNWGDWWDSLDENKNMQVDYPENFIDALRYKTANTDLSEIIKIDEEG